MTNPKRRTYDQEFKRNAVLLDGYHCQKQKDLLKIERCSSVFENFTLNGQIAGSPMITADLQAEKRFSKVIRTRVTRKMKAMGLQCKTVQKFVVTTDSSYNETVAHNLWNRPYSVSRPNTVWATDISYIK